MHEYHDGQIWDRTWSEVTATESGDDPFGPIDRVKYRRLASLLPRMPARTLEVGSGSARLSTWLARAGHLATCLDRSEVGLRVARENFRRIGRPESLSLADAAQAPFADATFDVVLSTGLLEHFVDPQPVINEMTRVLKPGGLFYSDIVPDKVSLFRLFRAPRLKRLIGRPEPFERPMSRIEIMGYLRAAGLDDIQVAPMGVYPPLPPGLWRLRPVLRTYQVVASLPVWRQLDDRSWAEPLALYYFCSGRKPCERRP
jgi:SAM-dependent methyltransferase